MRKPIHNRPTRTQIPIRTVIINEKSSNTFHCDMCKNHLVQYNCFNWCIHMSTYVKCAEWVVILHHLQYIYIYNYIYIYIIIYIYAHVDSGCLHISTGYHGDSGSNRSWNVFFGNSRFNAMSDAWSMERQGRRRMAARPSEIYFNDPM